MFNILSNALKYTPSNGNIKVKVTVIQTEKTRTIVLSKQKHVKFENWLQINVTDTGIGISKRNIEKIFERFYQAQDNIKTAVGGTGIGLSVVKEMVQVHFGKISVESLEGKGTTFTILIPLIEEGMLEGNYEENKINSSEHINIKFPESEDDEKSISINENKNIGDHKYKLLVVEDNADMREYIKEELQNEFTILEACNGNQGFDIAINESPDLILSDIMMPNIDGIEFCKKIKTDERTSHIAVILLTARSSRESKIEGLETGADDYLTKPFYSDELRLRINNIIESRRKFREQFGKTLELKPSNIQITSVDQKFIKNAINIIEENIDDPEFGVEKFSHLIGMSRVALYNKLKALTDNSVQEFIFVIKLKRAAQLLRESGKSVTEITYDVGFKDPSHFSKLFKKHYGLSPKAYINEYNKDKV
jgi:DNA-binding response OmpR family regulator